MALADLVTDIFIEFDEVAAGETFRFTNLISNVKDVVSTCSTETAGASNTKMDVYYSDTQNGSYQEISVDNFFAIPPITPESQARENYDVLFTTPGYYNIQTKADGKEIISERNENNNEAQIDGKGKRSVRPQLGVIIKVTEGKNLNPTPQMILLNRTVIIE